VEDETRAVEAYQQYRESKNPAYLKESIQLYISIADARRPHRSLSETLMTLGHRRWELCVLTGKKTEDIEGVIELFEEAKHLWSVKGGGDSEPQRKEHYAGLLVSLGDTYRELYDKTVDKFSDGAIQKAISCYEEARTFKDANPHMYHKATLQLGLSLWSRCHWQGHTRRLRAAIRYLEEAYMYFDGKPLAQICVYNLANAYFTLSGKPGSTTEDLNFAIEYYQNSIDLLRPGSPDLGMCFYNISQALIRRYHTHYEVSDLKAAASSAKNAKEALPKEQCPRVEEILAYVQYVSNPRVNTVSKRNGKVKVGTDGEQNGRSHQPNVRETKSISDKDSAVRAWMLTQRTEFPPLPDIPISNGRPNSPTPARSIRSVKSTRPRAKPTATPSTTKANEKSIPVQISILDEQEHKLISKDSSTSIGDVRRKAFASANDWKLESPSHSPNTSGSFDANSDSSKVPLLKDYYEDNIPMRELQTAVSIRTYGSRGDLRTSPVPTGRGLPSIPTTLDSSLRVRQKQSFPPSDPASNSKSTLPRSPRALKGPRPSATRQQSQTNLRNTMKNIIDDVNSVEEEFQAPELTMTLRAPDHVLMDSALADSSPIDRIGGTDEVFPTAQLVDIENDFTYEGTNGENVRKTRREGFSSAPKS